MKTILENEYLRCTVLHKGAELCSLVDKSTNIEHIWKGDPAVWGRHAPVLFPIVGQVKNNEYTYQGNTYHLTQHGFARDKTFEVVESTPNKVSLAITSDESTKAVFPFEFKLILTYILTDKRVDTHYEVINTGSEKMWFSIGGHPGITCPFEEGEGFNEYYIEFEHEETCDRLLFANGLLTGKSEPYLQNNKSIDLSHAIFDNDALIFEGLKSSYCTLKSSHQQTRLRFHFPEFPMLAFWTKPNTLAPYLCIEPWFGVADSVAGDTSFDQKKGIQQLEPEKNFNCCYGIELL